MIDLSTGVFTIDANGNLGIKPFLTKDELLLSDLSAYGYKEDLSGSKYIFLPSLTIDGFPMTMEVHIGRKNFIDEIILRTQESPESKQWIQGQDLIGNAYNIKQKHDEFLMKETGLGKEFFDKGKDFRLETNWGSISSVIDMTSDQDIHISIRYRNLTDEEKNKYLILGKKYLNANK